MLQKLSNDWQAVKPVVKLAASLVTVTVAIDDKSCAACRTAWFALLLIALGSQATQHDLQWCCQCPCQMVICNSHCDPGLHWLSCLVDSFPLGSQVSVKQLQSGSWQVSDM